AERMRTAVQADVPGPARLAERLQEPSRGAGPARLSREAGFVVTVADAGQRHIDREQHRRAAGFGRAVDQVVHERAVADHVKLEPDGLADRLADFLEAADRYRRKTEGHVR